MRRIIALGILWLAAFPPSGSAQVADPAQDYQERFQTPPDLRLDVDLDADGYPETFLSNERLQNGKAGRVWTVYQGTSAGWRLLEKPATFRPDLLKISPATKDTPASLLTFWPGGKEEGIVQRISLAGGAIVEEKVEEISNSAAIQYFDKSSPLAVEPKSLAAFAIRAPTEAIPAAVAAPPEAAPEPRVKERTTTRTWVIAGIALLLIYGVLHFTIRRRWQ
jgi:hypothetical protein